MTAPAKQPPAPSLFAIAVLRTAPTALAAQRVLDRACRTDIERAGV